MAEGQLPRVFEIVNKDGESVHLNDLKTFADKPQGLGLSLAYTTYDSIHGSVVSDTSYSDTDIQFELTFGYDDNPYKRYHEFAAIITKPPLILKYKVPYVGEYQRRVVVKSFTKSDIDPKWSSLLSTLSLKPISPWFQWVSIVPEKIDEGDLDNNKGYYYHPDGHYYKYPYKYSVSTNSIRYLAKIENDSIIPVENGFTGMKVTIMADSETGPIINPEWKLLDSEYKEIQTERIIATINEGESLTVNSAYGEEEVSIFSPINHNKDDGSKYLDPTTRGFIQVPVGVSYLQLTGSWKNCVSSIGDRHISLSLRKEWGVI